MEYGAQSEYGRLRKVLMHWPTEEMRRITPGNRGSYLFRDVVYWKEFQREHDVFTDALRGEGVVVLLMEDLLQEGNSRTAANLPNLVYTRDVCTVNSQRAYTPRVTYQARYAEPLLVERVMKELGISIAHCVTPLGVVEGGDFV
ncbi:MAG: hypothetical protein JSV27_11310 [Candidatus Bathyarchaeota archaeon]|nr:MAG: hypothetical protein JSV27_11310 [Candidatus Bathyarchaeota archaeon]